MKRTAMLSILVIAAVLATAYPASAQLEPANPGAITMETNLDARGSFEALAQRAGLNVVSRSLTSTDNVLLKVENKSITESLDLLSKQTNTFWTPFDSKTILVLPETQQNRRDYDRQYVHRIPADRPAVQVLQELRNTHQLSGAVSGTGNAILLRDVKPRLSLAESLLGNPGTPIGGEALANLYLTQVNSSLRTPASVRSQLKIKVPGPVSLNVNESVRVTFETLARMSGVNIIFAGSYPVRTHTLRIDGVNYFDALDLLAFETGSFWQPINETTIVVHEDTQQNRRDYGSQLMETIYLAPGVSSQKLLEIMNSLRTLFSLRGVYQNEPANAILIRDTTANVVLVEAMAEEMSGAPIRKEVAANALEGFSETGGPFRTSADVRSKLKVKVAGTVSLRMNAPSNTIFENLTTMAGLDLLFTAPARLLAFNVEGQDIVDALDFLAFQGRYFWQPLDDRTIQVLEDTQQNRRDYERQVVKTIYLPSSTPTVQLNQIMNVLRTALSLRGVYQNENAKAILIKDTPARVALTERVVRQLNVQPGEVTSALLPVPGATENTVRNTSSAVRAELKAAISTPVSINLNQDVRASYELLGQMAGLRVTFDPRVVASGPVRFSLTAVDSLDALSYFALQTETFWKVVDERTILVAPDTRQAHEELDPRISKTFYLTNAKTTVAVSGIINVLRTALALRQVELKGSDGIEVWDTPQRVALAEQVIVSLDKAR